MNQEYLSYLRSKEWREKRKEFLEEANYECSECGEKKNLQVHHLNYDCVGEEDFDDVEVLCKECHQNKELEKGTDLREVDDYGEW
jgi:5-methylcytosine-specific restriction endonuclease McrA